MFTFNNAFGLIIKAFCVPPRFNDRIKLTRCSLLWGEGLEGKNTY